MHSPQETILKPQPESRIPRVSFRDLPSQDPEVRNTQAQVRESSIKGYPFGSSPSGSTRSEAIHSA